MGDELCTLEQKQNIMSGLHTDYCKRFRIHYAVLSLPFIGMGIPFYLKNHYTYSGVSYQRISCEKKYCEKITKMCGNDYIVLK